jgi:hypothetical protein
MTRDFPWTPSTLPQGSYVFGVCQVCREVRYVTRAMMLERAGDVAFSQIEHRLRCISRPLHGKRGPACGGKMTLALGSISGTGDPEARGGWPSLPTLPR